MMTQVSAISVKASRPGRAFCLYSCPLMTGDFKMTNDSTQKPKKIELKDYQSPDFRFENVQLSFDLNDDFCLVTCEIEIHKVNPHSKTMTLDGVDLDLKSIEINGETLPLSRFTKTSENLTVLDVPDRFHLKTVVSLKPQENTSLEGLYRSGNLFATQCEAQGFRKITYFLDRPDVMTTYKVSIEADRKKYPHLLSNGDRIQNEERPNGRHRVTWKDPFRKPCYLFALIAGDLAVVKNTFKTRSGKNVNLEIYVAHGQQDRCGFAMESLKKSMQWDEERFGREYDLSTYMIVAVDDFNAGAMENKGLNVFNSRLVLADAKTAADANYFAIESVIAHEYFHNWTGNRVTLRDWFHLSLKEGLTVFRDQEFSMDLHSRAMIRIDTVADLRSNQFAEDAGPNSHPIRPESCYAVDNFFTSTIYEKGAEVIRMMQTMVGRPGFRKGMDLYFERHDGQAVIIEDFARAISEPNQQDWSQFQLWYSQAGTPHIKVNEKYLPEQKAYQLELKQYCPVQNGQKANKPFHIPLVIGLLSQKGEDLKLNCAKIQKNSEDQTLLHFKQESETFEFTGLDERPVLSLNRGFSAPVHLEWDASENDLLFLLAHDSDAFNRWEAAQKLMIRNLLKMIEADQRGDTPQASAALLGALGKALDDSRLDLNLKAKLLELPSDSYLWQLEKTFSAESFYTARVHWEKSFAEFHQHKLLEIYKTYHGKNDHSLHHTHMAERRLKNTALAYLGRLKSEQDLVWNQFMTAAHMTDLESAFAICLDFENDLRDQAIKTFHQKWRTDSLTMNKWFAVIALSTHPRTAETVKALWDHPDFNSKNPNRVYSLLGRFGDNLVRFHESEGLHYKWMSEKILELDRLNPQVATRVAGAFDMCLKVGPQAKLKAKEALDSILKQNLSKNTFEVTSKTRDSLG